MKSLLIFVHQSPHCPLIPAFSPSGGEGVRRTDEGVSRQFDCSELAGGAR